MKHTRCIFLLTKSRTYYNKGNYNIVNLGGGGGEVKKKGTSKDGIIILKGKKPYNNLQRERHILYPRRDVNSCS